MHTKITFLQPSASWVVCLVFVDSFNLSIYLPFCFFFLPSQIESTVLDLFICNRKLHKHIIANIGHGSKYSIWNELKCLPPTSAFCKLTLTIDRVHALIFIVLGTVVLAETQESKLSLPQMKAVILNWLCMLVVQFWIHVSEILLFNNITFFFLRSNMT